MDMLEVFAIEDIDSLPETKWHIKQPADEDDRPNALLTGSIITHVMCVQVCMGASISMNLLFSKFRRRNWSKFLKVTASIAIFWLRMFYTYL